MGITKQFTRYVIVGLASNTFLYFLYLLITWFGIGPKTAMTLLYSAGVAQTFYFNRSWSFGHKGRASSALLRYIAAYAFGYVFNLAALLLLVDSWNWPHQWVQGVMIFVIAVMLFLLQRYWVFRSIQVHSA
ncbi:MAG: GtrA family protein [Rhodocyclaceae bacterium]|nr:GtrA family protein [Rhodocyclaceae bacterium]